MKVILTEEVKGQGGEGDVIDVKTGYAVNFLFPKKLAIQATPGNLKQLELRKHNIQKRESSRVDTAENMQSTLDGKIIRIGAKVGEEGQLFGSVTSHQVADAINEHFGTTIDRKHLDLHGLIKTAGEHPVTVAIYRETKATVIIEVVDEKALAAEAAAAAAPEVAEEAPEAEATAEVEAVAEEVAAAAEVTDEVAEEVEAVEAAEAAE